MSAETLPTAPGGFPGRARRFYLDVLGEMRKVTWPTRDEVRKATLAIIVFVGILGITIGLMDSVFQTVLVKLVARLF
ncbi:MAG: preprotein translocase subunit SecE [Candidatus Krumholzibacteria bacterium]|nr:preprotein translocase subunit SecE [Candidatus Krumholzibacteria bacterium]